MSLLFWFSGIFLIILVIVLVVRPAKLIVLFSQEFKMAETDFGDSIKQIVEEIASEIHDKDQSAAADSESAADADHTPVRRRARIVPRVVRVAARF